MSGALSSKFLKPRMRPQAIDIQAAVMWGVAAGSTALWIVQVPQFFITQPFDWLKKTFFKKSESQGN